MKTMSDIPPHNEGGIEATRVLAFYFDERVGRHCMEMQDGTRAHVDF